MPPKNNMQYTLFKPSSYFIVSGSGDADQPLLAFDKALLDAGIGDVNLIRISSIIAPAVKRIAPIQLSRGSFVATAYGHYISSKRGAQIAAAIAIAHPRESDQASIIMEYGAEGNAIAAEQKARKMALDALEYRGLEIDRVESTSVECIVSLTGCVFAGIAII